MSQEEIDVLRMEYNTWGLLQALMPCVASYTPSHHIDLPFFLCRTRKTEPEFHPSPRQLLTENPYTPTYTLAQATMNTSRTLSELVAIREWLHDTAPTPGPPDATTGYWRFTKHRVMQTLRMGNSGQGAEGVVRTMDPDAPLREDKALAADDAVSIVLSLAWQTLMVTLGA